MVADHDMQLFCGSRRKPRVTVGIAERNEGNLHPPLRHSGTLADWHSRRKRLPWRKFADLHDARRKLDDRQHRIGSTRRGIDAVERDAGAPSYSRRRSRKTPSWRSYAGSLAPPGLSNRLSNSAMPCLSDCTRGAKAAASSIDRPRPPSPLSTLSAQPPAHPCELACEATNMSHSASSIALLITGRASISAKVGPVPE